MTDTERDWVEAAYTPWLYFRRKDAEEMARGELKRADIVVREGRFYIDVNGRSVCHNASLDAAATVLGLAIGSNADAVRGFLAALDGWA